MDNKKPEPERYNDLVIWYELIELAKQKEKDILFISDDRKEDWVLKINGIDVGTRNDLVKEFTNESGHLFYSITTKHFIEQISKELNITDTKSLELETENIAKNIEKQETYDLEVDLSPEKGKATEFDKLYKQFKDTLKTNKKTELPFIFFTHVEEKDKASKFDELNRQYKDALKINKKIESLDTDFNLEKDKAIELNSSFSDNIDLSDIELTLQTDKIKKILRAFINQYIDNNKHISDKEE